MSTLAVPTEVTVVGTDASPVTGATDRFRVAEIPFGPERFSVIAGPCAVESREQLMRCAAGAQAAGAALLRGGAYKPRTSHRSFQGLGEQGLDLLAEAKAVFGFGIVTELLDVRDVARVAAVADVIQIGARNMHNAPLLREAGRTQCAVMLKRGFGSTIDEFLHAADYVLAEGNSRVILCERGIRTFETSYRFTLDVAAIPVLRERTELPVIVDPSHAAGRTELVAPLAMAAAAAGADGLMIESHYSPAAARCDGDQAVGLSDLADLIQRAGAMARMDGRRLVRHPRWGAETGTGSEG